jgi:hypothetical protein
MEKLVEEVYHCTHCVPLGLPFVACGDAGRAFRFPPTIGATGPAPLLFVGINPRVSESNQHLHSALMRDLATFRALAGNRFNGREYIGRRGLERHYATHVRIAEQLFPRKPFHTVAAVTELFFCASQSSRGLRTQPSPCADKYFARVIAAIRPKIVFAVGRPVEDYLALNWDDKTGGRFLNWGRTGRALVLAIPHPNSFGEKKVKLNAAIDAAKAYWESQGFPAAF